MSRSSNLATEVSHSKKQSFASMDFAKMPTPYADYSEQPSSQLPSLRAKLEKPVSDRHKFLRKYVPEEANLSQRPESRTIELSTVNRHDRSRHSTGHANAS